METEVRRKNLNVFFEYMNTCHKELNVKINPNKDGVYWEIQGKEEGLDNEIRDFLENSLIRIHKTFGFKYVFIKES